MATIRAKRGSYKKRSNVRVGGLEIAGLQQRPDGRFYPKTDPNQSFGKDLMLAVHRFKKWQLKQKGVDLEPLDPAMDDISWRLANEQERIRTLILTDHRQAAIELRIPELAFFSQIKTTSDEQVSLQEMVEKFLEKKRNKRGKLLGDEHKHMCREMWKDFLDFTKAKFAVEISEQQIIDYSAETMKPYDAETKSQSWVKHRFSCPKAILSFAGRKQMDGVEAERVLKLCKKHWDTPEAPNPDPNPISRENLHAILKVANTRQKAIILTALNLCLKSGEVAQLHKADINPDGTVVSERSKTGVTRVGVLWQHTREAIQAYQQEQPHHAAHLFNSRIGTPLTAKAAGRIMQQLRKVAKIPPSVTFDTLRDGAYTNAICGGATETQAKALGGHKIQMSDQYLRRNPRIVMPAIEAIEQHYFG